MNKNWLKYVVGIALLVNVLTLVFLLLRKPPPPLAPEDKLVTALKLDAAQQKKFEILRGQHRALRTGFSEQIKKMRIKQYQNMPSDTDSTMVAIGRIYEALERSNVQHFADIRALCRPDQQAQFDGLLVEIIRTMPKKIENAPPQ